MKKRTIYHIDDQWFVYHTDREGVDVSDNEYTFDTFEEVVQWVESSYWEATGDVVIGGNDE